MLLRLADSLVLPLNVSDYGEALEGLYSVAAEGQVQADLAAHNISLGEAGGSQQGCPGRQS